ncbi:MAG: AAA family ATPase [Beijerinckiaceae bacterium]|nr:AAA family ATPase [Beijerinckiaceae bacterium]
MAGKSRNLSFGAFRLEPGNARLWRGKERVTLAPKPFDLLCLLAGRSGELVTKDELLTAVWSNLHVSESSLSVAINALRLALGDDPKSPRYIETVSRRGYRFIAPVSLCLPRDAEQLLDEFVPPPRILGGSRSRSRLWVGRAGPIEELDDLLLRATAGTRQLAFVTGEAGIGKSTLVEMFLERTSWRGVRIMLGRCVEHFGTDEAFLPLLEALQDYCTGPNEPMVLHTLRQYAPTWLVQLPGLLEDKDYTDLQKEVFGATRERMLREFCEFLEALGSELPLVFIIEDLHWSDYATLDVVSRFVRRTGKAAVFLVATYRPIDVRIECHPTGRLHQELQRYGLCAEIPVERLSQAEVEQYLALRFSDTNLAHILVERVFPRSGGQALFVTSLVDDLIARQEIVEVEGNWRLSFQKPVSHSWVSRDLREMIGSQIDRLTAEEQRLLEAASVAGAEFSAASLVGVLSEDVCEVEQICEMLARKGLMLSSTGAAEWPDGTVAGRYAFLHSLYQEVLYRRLAPAQRMHLHRVLGERLEEGYGGKSPEIAAALALHFEEGHDFPKAISYLAQAAEKSLQRFSTSEAAAYLTRALNLVDRLPSDQQPASQVMLLHRRAWARRSAGDFRGSIEDLQMMVSRASAAAELRQEIYGLLDLSRFCLYTDRRKCLTFAKQAVAKCRDADDDVLRALVQGNCSNLILMLKGWSDADAEVCREAAKTMADSRDPRILLRRSSLDVVRHYYSSNYPGSCAAGNDGKQLAQTIGDEYYYVLLNTMVAFSYLHLGEWRELQQCVSTALAMTERNANIQGSALGRLTIGWLHAEALDFAGARTCYEDPPDPAVEANPFSFFIGRNLLAKANVGLRDYPAAFAQFNAIQRRIEADGIGMDYSIYPHFHSNFCQYWLETGDLNRAREEAMRLYEISALPPERTYLALAHRLLAKIAMAEGKLEDARDHLLRAVAIVEKAKLPLAAWRVYATSACLYERGGEVAQAAESWRLSRQIIDSLSETFDHDDPLRASLLAGYAAEGLR